MNKRSKSGQKVQTSGYEISRSLACTVEHGDYNTVLYIQTLLRDLILKVLIPRKKFVVMGGDGG